MLKKFFVKEKKYQQGFGMIDLLVSIGIVIIIFTFVMANFRGGQRSGELDSTLKQIINAITTVRNMSMGGQLIDNPLPPPLKIYPAGGYGIRFVDSPASPDEFILYAVSAPGAGYSPGDELANGIKEFEDIEFDLCGLDAAVITALPCESPWDANANPLEIIFSLPNDVTTIPANFKYVGGRIRNTKTNKEAYFYVSMLSGLVTGEIL